MEAIITKSRASLPPPQAFGRGRGGEPEQPPPPPGPEIQMGDGPIHVEWSKSDQMFKDMIARQANFSRLPYLHRRFGADQPFGRFTDVPNDSTSVWNRKRSELLCPCLPRNASVAAEWLGVNARIRIERLNDAWTLVSGRAFS